jgi:hypothetical protein
MGSSAWILHNPEMFVVEQFLRNQELLETNWRVATHVSPRILVAPISDLELLELVVLRDGLFAAHYSHDIICEAEISEDMQMWVPPSAHYRVESLCLRKTQGSWLHLI